MTKIRFFDSHLARAVRATAIVILFLGCLAAFLYFSLTAFLLCFVLLVIFGLCWELTASVYDTGGW